jgi:hypothetical protein
MDTSLITTSTGLDGYKVVKHLGVVRGITVRSRSVVGNFAGGIQSLFGGRLSVYVELCENAREEAYHLIDTTCAGNRRQCHHQYALRCQRSNAGHYRSIGLWYCCCG